MRVYLTVDFFLRAWDQGNGELWACFQPHVAGADLLEYVQKLDEQQLEYLFVDPGVEKADKEQNLGLTPVNLPSKVNLSLELLRASGLPLRAEEVDLGKVRERVGKALAPNPESPLTRLLWDAIEPVEQNGFQEALTAGDDNARRLVADLLSKAIEKLDLAQAIATGSLDDEDKELSTRFSIISAYKQRHLRRRLLEKEFSLKRLPGLVWKAVRNKRSEANVIKDEKAYEAFSAVNREPRPGNRPAEAPKVQGPFASAYNAAIQQGLRIAPNASATGKESAERFAGQLQQMLQLAFWGGARRAVPRDAFDKLDEDHLMVLPRESVRHPLPAGDLLVTNLHGLNGLMLRLGGKDELDELTRIAAFELTLTQEGKRTMVPLPDKGQEDIQGYFSTLGEPCFPEAKHLVSGRMLQEIHRRVHVRDHLSAFSRVETQRWFFQRPAERKLDTNARQYPIKKLVVFVINGAPDPGDKIPWRAYASYEARLVP